MAFSLLTTIAGLIGGILLRAQYMIAENLATDIVQVMVQTTETSLLPRLKEAACALSWAGLVAAGTITALWTAASCWLGARVPAEAAVANRPKPKAAAAIDVKSLFMADSLCRVVSSHFCRGALNQI